MRDHLVINQFDWLEDFDDDALVRLGVNAFVHFRVLSSSDLLDDFVVLLRSAQIKQPTLTSLLSPQSDATFGR